MTIDASERRNAARRREAQAAQRRDGPVPYRRVGSLGSTKQDSSSSENTYFIKLSGKDMVEFGEREYFLWRLLDGTNSAGDIEAKFKDRFGTTLTPEQFDSFVNQLVECGAVESHDPDEAVAPRPLAGALVPSPLDEFDLDTSLDEFGLVDEVDEPEQEPEQEKARVPFSIRLFDPSGALRILDLVGGPLRFFSWLLLPALVGMLACVALEASAIVSAFAAAGPWQALWIGFAGLLVLGIVPPLSQAVVASFLGYSIPECRIAFRWRILPRLAFDDTGWGRMAWRHVLTVVAAPCVARLVLFAAGIGTWLATRAPGAILPVLALAVGLLGLVSFLISAAPFLHGQGRRWLATAFGRPSPWSAGGGFRLHAVVLSGLWGATVAAIVLVLGGALLQAAQPQWWLAVSGERIVRLGAWPLLAILTVMPVVTRLWLAGMLRSHGALQPKYAYAGVEALYPGLPLQDRGTRGRTRGEPAVAPMRREVAERWPSTTPIIIWAIVVGVAVAVAFVPYPYEAGGNFTLLPYEKVQVNARVPGELTEVLVSEGDPVKPGQLLGTLSDWDARHNLENARAQLEAAKAALQVLIENPRPEDIELARKQYEAAVAKLPYDKSQYERYAAMVTTDAVSRANYEQVLSTYQQDQAAAEVARANYDQLRAGSTPAQIEQARATVRQYTASVSYYEDQLERTRIRATSAGKVVTPNPQLLRGQWYNPNSSTSALIFTIEDQQIVQADIYVPETDIDHVQTGGTVRARPWAYPGTTFIGMTAAVAHDAQTDPFGSSTNVVRVRAQIPNPDGNLRPTMTGYAKLTGTYLPTWEAFMQTIIRFFRVSLWSWIP